MEYFSAQAVHYASSNVNDMDAVQYMHTCDNSIFCCALFMCSLSHSSAFLLQHFIFHIRTVVVAAAAVAIVLASFQTRKEERKKRDECVQAHIDDIEKANARYMQCYMHSLSPCLLKF